MAGLGRHAADQHRRDQGDRVKSRAGSAASIPAPVADVVADVVLGDDRRVARIVLGNAGFDLADEVRADVGALVRCRRRALRRSKRSAKEEPKARPTPAWGLVLRYTGLEQADVVARDAEQGRPTTSMPVIAPPRNATASAAWMPPRALTPPRARSAPGADVTRQSRQHGAEAEADGRERPVSAKPITTKRMTPTIAIVRYYCHTDFR